MSETKMTVTQKSRLSLIVADGFEDTFRRLDREITQGRATEAEVSEIMKLHGIEDQWDEWNLEESHPG